MATDARDAPIESEALICRGPFSEGKWAIEPVTLRDLEPDEVVVELVASGICHTDLHCGNTADDKGVPGVYYPRVLGHEGKQVDVDSCLPFGPVLMRSIQVLDTPGASASQ